VYNIYISACNHGLAGFAYSQRCLRAVGEIHLAVIPSRRSTTPERCHRRSRLARRTGSVGVYPEALAPLGRGPTLIEWDSRRAAMAVLLEERSCRPPESDRQGGGKV